MKNSAHKFFHRDFFAPCKEVLPCDGTAEVKRLLTVFVHKLRADR